MKLLDILKAKTQKKRNAQPIYKAGQPITYDDFMRYKSIKIEVDGEQYSVAREEAIRSIKENS